MAGLPQFPISTQTDPYWEIPMYDAAGNPLSIEGRVFEAWIAPAQTKQGVAEPVKEIKVLTFQDGLSLVPPTDGSGDQTVKNTLVHQVSRAFAQANFPRGELTADLLEVVDGARRLFAPVRLFYADPAQIREFVADRAGITFGPGRQPIVTPVAIAGQAGRRGSGLLTGTLPPQPSDGEDGDYWVVEREEQANLVYGPKENGEWPPQPSSTFGVKGVADIPDAGEAAKLGVATAEQAKQAQSADVTLTPATGGALGLTAQGSSQPDKINLLGFANDVVRCRSRFTSGGVLNHLGLRQAMVEAHDYGKRLVLDNDVTPTGTIQLGKLLGADLHIIGERNAKITAPPGFPASKLLFVTGGLGRTLTFKGVDIDARNVPNSAPGQANDALNFGLYGAERLVVEDVNIIQGDDFRNAGADSGIYAGWARSMWFDRIFVQGAWDSAIYLSGGGGPQGSGTGQEEISEEIAWGTLTFKNTYGLIIKRVAKRISGGTVRAINCPSGAVIGASATVGGTTTSTVDGSTVTLLAADAKDVALGNFLGENCETLLDLRYVRGGHVSSVISRDMGTYVAPHTAGDASTGYRSTTGQALLLSGCQGVVVGRVEGNGPNAAAAVANARAVRVVSRVNNPNTTAAETRPSTNNTVKAITARNIPRSIEEQDATQTGNRYEVVEETGTTNPPIILSPTSQLDRSTGFIREIVGQVSVGGLQNSEVARFVPVANQINRWQFAGSATGADLTMQPQGTDANIGFRLQGKGTSGGRLGHGAGWSIMWNSTGVGFNAANPIAKGTISGSRADGTALQNLLTYLQTRGDITNSSTA